MESMAWPTSSGLASPSSTEATMAAMPIASLRRWGGR